ncbi:FkbM family methyltransferase [archaeon]|nr:MAG: FkbM family methyltransferase [archaeon]
MKIFTVLEFCVTIGCSYIFLTAAAKRFIQDFGPNTEIVECVDGTFVLPKLDQVVSKYLKNLGQYERNHISLIKDVLSRLNYSSRDRNSVILDIGANVGAWTVPLSAIPNVTIYSFEPQRHIVSVLRSTLLINSISNVILVNSAVGNASGFIALNDVHLSYVEQEINYGALSILGKLSHDKIPSFPLHSKVPVVMLDEFYQLVLHEHCPNFLKLDIEQYELYAFLGGMHMLRMCKPILFFESNCYVLNKSVFMLLSSLGYELFWVVVPLLDYSVLPYYGITQDLGTVASLPDHEFTETYFGTLNVLAVPAEMKTTVQKMYEGKLYHIQVQGVGNDEWTKEHRRSADDIQFRVEDMSIKYCVHGIHPHGSDESTSRCGNYSFSSEENTTERDEHGNVIDACGVGSNIPAFMADYWKHLEYLLYKE